MGADADPKDAVSLVVAEHAGEPRTGIAGYRRRHPVSDDVRYVHRDRDDVGVARPLLEDHAAVGLAGAE